MSDKTFLIEITSADKNSWYKNKIGCVLEVQEYSEHWFVYNGNRAIAKDNCQIVDEDKLAEGGTGESR